jgi:plastocyanin
VTIQNLAFSPNALTGTAGGTLEITLTNEDSVEHSFTLDDDSVNQDVEAGESETVEVTLPGSGSLGWHCKYHPQMTGTITVG